MVLSLPNESNLYDLVTNAVNRARTQTGKKELMLKPATALLGDDAILDSVSFVMLIVDLEQILSEQHGISANLTENEIILDPEGPFRTIGDLCKFLLALKSDVSPT